MTEKTELKSLFQSLTPSNYKIETVEDLVPLIKPKNVIDVFKSQTPSLVKIQEVENGEMKLKALMFAIVSDLVQFFNVGKTMSTNQIGSTVELLIECYPVYKLDDFVLCFKRAKLGQYGKLYDRIDGNIILDWFEAYIQERNTEFEQLRINEQKHREENPDEAVPMPDFMKEFKQSLLVKKSVEMLTPTQPKVLVQTEEQKRINELIFEFDKLWMEQGSNRGKKIVFIEREGDKSIKDRYKSILKNRAKKEKWEKEKIDYELKMIDFIAMDISEYLEYHFKQI